MLGLLEGAIGGIGKGMQQNAQHTMDERREERLMALREKYQIRQEDRAAERESQQWDRQIGREDELWNRQVSREDEVTAGNRAHEFALLGAQTDAASQGNWQLVQGQDGQAYQYNPQTNEYRVANLPEGASIPGANAGQLNDVQQARLRFLRDEIDNIREQLANDPLMDERDRKSLGNSLSAAIMEVEFLTQAGAGGFGGEDFRQRILNQLGGPSAGTPDDSPESGSSPGLLEQERARAEEVEAGRANAERTRAVDARIRDIESIISEATTGDADVIAGGVAAGVPGRGGAGMSAQQAQQLIAEIEALEQDLEPYQQGRAARIIRNLLPFAES